MRAHSAPGLPGPTRAPPAAHVTPGAETAEVGGDSDGSAALRRRPTAAPNRAPPALSRSQNGGEGNLEQSRSLSH